MNLKNELQKELEQVFEDLGYDKNLAIVTYSNLPDVCDFQCNASFAIAKQEKVAPMQIVEKIIKNCEKLQKKYDIFGANPGFINFSAKVETLNDYANFATTQKSLVKQHDKKLRIFLDYGGANVAKELHVGHLRSPIIGESLNRLYKLLGHDVISDTHLGDWGLQMGLTIAQLEEDGILDFYFGKSNAKQNITLEMLNVAYPKASLRKKTEPEFLQKAENYTLGLQQKKEPFYTIWKDIRNVSVEQIKKNYADLNAHFDLFNGESDASDYIDTIINIFKNKGLTRVSNDALVVDIAKEGEHIPMPKKTPDEEQKYFNPMPPAIIQKHNGGELYVTTDLATIYERNIKYPFDELHYVVDKRQANHFEQVFRCARLAHLIDDDKKLIHIGFGTMNGKDGKPFKTRDGGTIKLDDIVNLLKSKAKERLDQNQMHYDDKLPLQIGVGAMKFGDLSNSVSKDYIFDLDKFTAFEGKTGPYLQYTAVRIRSLLEKSDKNYGKIQIKNIEEKKILIAIMKVIDCYDLCFKEKTLNILCENLYNLASEFSVFYNNVKILSEPNLELRASYLSLSKLVLNVLAEGLNVLAMDIPEKM